MTEKTTTDSERRPDNYFEMLYCDNISCQVNTFERWITGWCPACGDRGLEVR